MGINLFGTRNSRRIRIPFENDGRARRVPVLRVEQGFRILLDMDFRAFSADLQYKNP